MGQALLLTAEAVTTQGPSEDIPSRGLHCSLELGK